MKFPETASGAECLLQGSFAAKLHTRCALTLNFHLLTCGFVEQILQHWDDRLLCCVQHVRSFDPLLLTLVCCCRNVGCAPYIRS